MSLSWHLNTKVLSLWHPLWYVSTLFSVTDTGRACLTTGSSAQLAASQIADILEEWII